MKKVLLLSFFLHCLAFSLLFSSFPKKVSEPPAIFVELPISNAPKVSESGAGNQGKKNSESTSSRKKSLNKNFSLKHPANSFSIDAKTIHGKSFTGISTEPENRVESFSVGMNLQKEGKFFPLAQKIKNRIDGFVGYPPDFVEENISGEIVLQFLVNSEGKFLKFLRVEGDNSHLTVYSMAMIVMALQDEIAQLPAGRELEDIPLSLRLSYRLLLPDEISNRKGAETFKNSIYLDRVAFTEPKPIKKMRRFIEKYTPPVIPVPGGFFIDFVSLYKHVVERDSDDPDWKRGVRMNLDQKQLQLFLKKQTG
jgi:hypothetical protein